MSDAKSDGAGFVQKRMANLWSKLARPGLTSKETLGALWEMELLKSSSSGCTEPIHEIDGMFQPDFEAIRKRRIQIERQLFRKP